MKRKMNLALVVYHDWIFIITDLDDIYWLHLYLHIWRTQYNNHGCFFLFHRSKADFQSLPTREYSATFSKSSNAMKNFVFLLSILLLVMHVRAQKGQPHDFIYKAAAQVTTFYSFLSNFLFSRQIYFFRGEETAF